MKFNNNKLNRKEMAYVYDLVKQDRAMSANEHIIVINGISYSLKSVDELSKKYDNELIDMAFNLFYFIHDELQVSANLTNNINNIKDFQALVNDLMIDCFDYSVSVEMLFNDFCIQSDERYNAKLEKKFNLQYKKYNENVTNQDLFNEFLWWNEWGDKRGINDAKKLLNYAKRLLNNKKSHRKTISELVDKLIAFAKEKRLKLGNTLYYGGFSRLFTSFKHYDKLFLTLTSRVNGKEFQCLPFWYFDDETNEKVYLTKLDDTRYFGLDNLNYPDMKYKDLYFDYYLYKSQFNYNGSLDNDYNQRGKQLTAKTKWAINPKYCEWDYQVYYNQFDMDNLITILSAMGKATSLLKIIIAVNGDKHQLNETQFFNFNDIPMFKNEKELVDLLTHADKPLAFVFYSDWLNGYPHLIQFLSLLNDKYIALHKAYQCKGLKTKIEIDYLDQQKGHLFLKLI